MLAIVFAVLRTPCCSVNAAAHIYAGEKGTIYVLNAGNLSTNRVDDHLENIDSIDTHLDHYLQGLPRVGFENAEAITNQFLRLIDNIMAQYKPDLILFDNRTMPLQTLKMISMRRLRY